MNSLFGSRIQVNLVLFSSIRCRLRKFTLNHFESTWINCRYSLFTLNPLSFLRMHYKFEICFAYSPWIHYPFFGITMNSPSISRNHYELTIGSAFHYENTFFFANLLSTSRSLSLNSLFFSWSQYDCTIFFTISLRIHHLFREFSLNSFFFFEFTICFANSPWIHDLFRNHYDSLWNHYEIIMNPLSASRFH